MSPAIPLAPTFPATRPRRPLAGLVIAVGLAVAVNGLLGPLPAVALAVAGTLFIARPFDPVLALGLVAALASFVDNETGGLTRQLALVTALTVYALVCLVLAGHRGRWSLRRSPLLVLLAAFLGWTLVCAVRGALAGYSLRFLGLEIAALFSLAFALMAGGLDLDAATLRRAGAVLIVTGLGHVTLGVVSYVVNRARTGGVWYTPLSGMLALLVFAFAVREARPAWRWGYATLAGLLVFDQLISFARGYWLGLLVALPWLALTYGGFGRGSGPRWRSIAGLAAPMVVVGLAATVATGVILGWGDLLGLVGTRFVSSFATQQSGESASNVARLVEYAASGRLISRSPWIGYGLGLEMHIRQPVFHVVTHQWFIHQSYLWLWIKEGLVGVVLLLATLGAAFATAWRGARRLEGEAAAWCHGTAAVTLYLFVVNFTTFHLAQVNSTLCEGLLWGIALALQSPARVRFVWHRRPAPA